MLRPKSFTVFLLALLGVLALSTLYPVPTVTADSAMLRCERQGSTYTIEYEVRVDARRLILIGVVDSEGNGHRVFRYVLKSGSKSGTITIKERRYGRLNRACIAVHSVSGDQETVASDCDYF